MDGRKIIAGILIVAEIAIAAVPFHWHFTGKQETNRLIAEFEEQTWSEEEEDGNEEESSEADQ